MAITKYSHAFLVGRIITNVTDTTLVNSGWEHVVTDESTYSELCSYYYQGHVNAMVECSTKPATFPQFLVGIRHFRSDVNRNAILPQRDYFFNVCQFHLFFFPLNITLLAIEIDDSGNSLDALTWGHSQLMGWIDNFTNFPVWTRTVFKPLEVLSERDGTMFHLEGNKLKLYQIINIPEKAIADKNALLYELATSSPIGCVNRQMWISPSNEYYNNVMKQNSVSAFNDWKGLALMDSFTMISNAEKREDWSWEQHFYLWNNHYFQLIYLRALLEKTFCFSRNSAYRMDENTQNLSQEVSDMERYYFYDKISYNFLPNLLYKAIAKGMELKEEREELSKQIKERTKQEDEKKKEKEENRRDIITLGLSIFAVFSIAWDLCEIIKDAFTGDYDHETAFVIFWCAIGVILVLAAYIFVIKKYANK